MGWVGWKDGGGLRGTSARDGLARLGRLGVALAIGLLALVLIGAALIDANSNPSAPDESQVPSNAVAVSLPELLVRASELGRPVFWVGQRQGTSSYELSSSSERVYVRYLTGDAKAGDQRADFLTVGTYEVPEASVALKEAAKTGPGQTLSRHQGYEALTSSTATNAYIVFDDQPDLQVEIFSPRRGEAAELAISGELKPLE